jgi:hypothetical protein
LFDFEVDACNADFCVKVDVDIVVGIRSSPERISLLDSEVVPPPSQGLLERCRLPWEPLPHHPGA